MERKILNPNLLLQLRRLFCAGVLVIFPAQMWPQAPALHTPQELLKAMIENERVALKTPERFEYVLTERSERTGGQAWTERIVETGKGRLRLLTSIDGRPLSPERAALERAKIEAIVQDPTEFLRREAAEHNDEERARHMLELLPVYFLFENVRLQDGVWQMDFQPNPAASPSGIEDEVLHGMSGHIAIDAHDLRLIHIDGTLLKPVTIGFGLLANIHAGSGVASDRRAVQGYWRMVRVKTEIHGKAALFKNLSRNSELARADFRLLQGDLTVQQAAMLLLR